MDIIKDINVPLAIYIVEGLLQELAEEGFSFRLTADLHSEEGFTKPVTGVKLANGAWETKSVELITEALKRRSELETFTIRTTAPAGKSATGRVVEGKPFGYTKIDLTAGVAVIESLGRLGTRDNLVPFCGTAVARAQAIAAELEALAEGQLAA